MEINNIVNNTLAYIGLAPTDSPYTVALVSLAFALGIPYILKNFGQSIVSTIMSHIVRLVVGYVKIRAQHSHAVDTGPYISVSVKPMTTGMVIHKISLVEKKTWSRSGAGGKPTKSQTHLCDIYHETLISEQNEKLKKQTHDYVQKISDMTELGKIAAETAQYHEDQIKVQKRIDWLTNDYKSLFTIQAKQTSYFKFPIKNFGKFGSFVTSNSNTKLNDYCYIHLDTSFGVIERKLKIYDNPMPTGARWVNENTRPTTWCKCWSGYIIDCIRGWFK